LQPTKDRLKKTSPADYELMRRFYFRPPTVTFSKEMTLYAGDHTFRLINLPGHTPYQIAVFIPEEKVIFTADNIFNKVPIWMQQADPFHWLESLDKMAELGAEIFVPGHGEVCGPACIPEMRARIQNWIGAVEDILKKGMTLEEAQRNFTFREDYPWDPDIAAMAPIVQKANLTRLYEILKNRSCT
jgi:cyclase